MPYSNCTLTQLITQISSVMDDTAQVYWTVDEIQFAVWEALRVWGAYTNYWRSRGVFNLSPTSPTFSDLSAYLPTLRTRTWTLGQMVREIQYMLLEEANGISGFRMTGQVSVSSILNAIQVTRNRFVLDAHLPLSVQGVPVNPPPPDGMVEFYQVSVFVHRASWQDLPSGTWTNLWREDAWSVDKGSPLWTLEPGSPQQYSEAENAPLKMQLSPPPINEGYLETLSVDSITIPLNDSSALFYMPDEWIHAVKYGALSYILGGSGQIKDPLRAEYAENRYQQAVEFAKDARSLLRLMCNNVPLNIDSLASLDAGIPYWRNQSGPPQVAGVLYDMVALYPGVLDKEYSLSADVVQSAPLPAADDYVQIGAEDLEHIIDYATHILAFKCGGDDFKTTISDYDSFMKAVASRKGVNAAKIRYLTPLFGTPQKEWAERPDRQEAKR